MDNENFGKRRLQHLVERNIDTVRRVYRQAYETGRIVTPVVGLVDARSTAGRELLSYADGPTHEATGGMTVFALPLDQALQAVRPHCGEESLRTLVSIGGIPSVVVTSDGHLYALAPESDDGSAENRPQHCQRCQRKLELGEGSHTHYGGIVCDACLASVPQCCDFCLEQGISWIYPAEDFEFMGNLSLGEWAACQICHELVQAKRWRAVARRNRSTQVSIGNW